MQRTFKIAEAVTAVLALMLYISRPAHAYIDAGTGSYFLQVSIGTMAGIVFSVKLFWTQIKQGILSLFSHKRPSDKLQSGRSR